MLFVMLPLMLLFGIVVFQVASRSVSYPKPPPEKMRLQVKEEIVNQENSWTTNNTHDPEIIKEGNTYYVFSTDYMTGGEVTPGIQIRKSTDLINWTFAGRVFEEVPREAAEWTNGGSTFWAPDIVKMNGRFYLYYSVSQLGERNSYIGVASSRSIEGPWEHEGAAVRSKNGDGKTVNAIDPSVLRARDGTYWMSYGSYFGGIFLVEIDPDTGLLKNSGEEGIKIAQRKNMDYAIEAPSLIYHKQTDMYYLMTSYGWLEDTYNVRVARSKNIEGPYVDFNGKEMIDMSDDSWDTGTKIVGSYLFNGDSGWTGTGHSAFLQDGENDYLLHNARAGEDLYWSHLHVRKVSWTADGWPVVSPERYAGETKQVIHKSQLPGRWEYVRLERMNDSQAFPIELILNENGSFNSDTGGGTWSLSEQHSLLLNWEGGEQVQKETLLLSPAWDWERWTETIVFSGLDEQGIAVWGKKN